MSRLGNPLFNEVIVPMASKDFWNSSQPAQDSQFAKYVSNPELANLLPILYTPPTAAGPADGSISQALFVQQRQSEQGRSSGDSADRDSSRDLVRGAVLPEFHRTDSGRHAPAQHGDWTIEHAQHVGPVGPRRSRIPQRPACLRRRGDDRTSLHRRRAGSRDCPWVSQPGDAAAGAIFDLVNGGTDTTVGGTEKYLSDFPYLGSPHKGYNAPSVAS